MIMAMSHPLPSRSPENQPGELEELHVLVFQLCGTLESPEMLVKIMQISGG